MKGALHFTFLGPYPTKHIRRKMLHNKNVVDEDVRINLNPARSAVDGIRRAN